MNTQAAEALLDEFRQQVPRRPKRLPTFMEITGYPHYENVCSNILAFFFDPGNPHGLGTLFLDALAQVGGIEDQEEVIGSNVEVDTQVCTDAGNFIDILILSDSHVILIENKIFYGIHNPFADYAKHLDSLANELDKHNKHKFLLTLKLVTNTANDHGFLNITHGDLVNKIRDLLGNYVAGADTRYLTFMLDFLNTLDYLQGGMVMNPEFVNFLASHSDEVEVLRKEIEAFKKELRDKITQLKALIAIESYRESVQQRLWRGKESPFADFLVHDITHPSFANKIAIDTVLSPKGWEIQFFMRNSKADERVKLQELLQQLNVQFEEREDRRYKGTRFTHMQHFNYAADLNQVAEVVRGVLFKLTGISSR